MSKDRLGEYLKRERELRHITLEEVADGTKIAIYMLRAIEEDRWHDLPAEVFIKGFLRSYAEFIGLEPDEIILRYKEEKIKVGASPEKTFEYEVRPTFKIKERFTDNPITRWIIIVVIVAILALGLTFWMGDNKDSQPVLPKHSANGTTLSTNIEHDNSTEDK